MIITYSSSFYKDIKRIPKDYIPKVSQIVAEIKAANSIRSIKNCKKLKGNRNVYRIRINDYRIIFFLIKIENTIRFQRILLWGQVYKKGVLSEE